METILITVSVLSTLAIVAMVLTVVVILKTLKDKVDVKELEELKRNLSEKDIELGYEISGIINEIGRKSNITGIISRSEETNSRINKLEDAMYREIEERHREINNDVDDINRRIDSRHDKLHDHIGKEVENLYREINNNQKVLLKD